MNDLTIMRELQREVAALHAQLQQERQRHSGTIDQRDRAQEAADRLAYAMYDTDEIGEHSNLNCPWENAVERLEALAPAPAEALLMPGEKCVHKKGGRYVVVSRVLAPADAREGRYVAAGGNFTAMTTDPIEKGEQIVIYQSLYDHHSFARPARLFDEPGRFTRAALDAELPGK